MTKNDYFFDIRSVVRPLHNHHQMISAPYTGNRSASRSKPHLGPWRHGYWQMYSPPNMRNITGRFAPASTSCHSLLRNALVQLWQVFHHTRTHSFINYGTYWRHPCVKKETIFQARVYVLVSIDIFRRHPGISVDMYAPTTGSWKSSSYRKSLRNEW